MSMNVILINGTS